MSAKKQKKVKVKKKVDKFDKAISNILGKKYDKKLKKEEKTNLLHYILKQLGLRRWKCKAFLM